MLDNQTVYRWQGETYPHFGLLILYMICLLAMAHVEKLGLLQVSQFVVIVSLVNNIIGHIESRDVEGRSGRRNMSRSRIKARPSQMEKLYLKRWVPSKFNANAGSNYCNDGSWSDGPAQCLTMLG